MPNVHNDDTETLWFADESEYGHGEPTDEDHQNWREANDYGQGERDSADPDLPPIDADAVIELGRLTLALGLVPRATRHPDGLTRESDTTHTVMLGLVACALAPMVRDDLDVGLVAQYALVHDLVEAYAGDTNTLHPDADYVDKDDRERAALRRIIDEFGQAMPWLVERLCEYVAQEIAETRYVRALDKLLPKITHILNAGAAPVAAGLSFADVVGRYVRQLDELRAYADDFAPLFGLRSELLQRMYAVFPGGTPR